MGMLSGRISNMVGESRKEMTHAAADPLWAPLVISPDCHAIVQCNIVLVDVVLDLLGDLCPSPGVVKTYQIDPRTIFTR